MATFPKRVSIFGQMQQRLLYVLKVMQVQGDVVCAAILVCQHCSGTLHSLSQRKHCDRVSFFDNYPGALDNKPLRRVPLMG